MFYQIWISHVIKDLICTIPSDFLSIHWGVWKHRSVLISWTSFIDIKLLIFGSTLLWICDDTTSLKWIFIDILLPTENDDRLILQLKDTSLEFSWPIGRIKDALSSLGGPFPSTPMSCSSETFNLILAMIEEQNIPEAKTSLASGVSAFLWLYTSILGYVVLPF